MENQPRLPPGGSVAPSDAEYLETALRDAARALCPDQLMDDLEVRHLVRVISECSLLLTDVYSAERIARIMSRDRGILVQLASRLVEPVFPDSGDLLYRVRSLPDDVRVVGDKALFDHGLLGLKRVKGYDLEDLGSRAYRIASEALELLAKDRRLREFFRQNRLLVLPLEEEVVFLRQCSERFPTYASILKRIQSGSAPGPLSGADEIRARVPLMAAAAEVLSAEAEAPGGPGAVSEPAPPLESAPSVQGSRPAVLRDDVIAAYERMALFGSVDLERLRASLRAVVVDQDAAVDVLCDEFSLFAAGTRDPRKPPAYFLVGPTGVGKNHLVESLCRVLEGVWGIEVPTLLIEGPSYTYPSDINELRGATRGFIRSEEEGILSAFHERSSKAPLSVIVVDEVEKAHPQLRTFFLPILDRGSITDNRGKVLRFSSTMFFFTSNLGYSDAQQRSAPIGYLDDEARSSSSDRDVRQDIRKTLAPEFMNRLRMIHFERLSQASAERILGLEFERIACRYADVHELRLVLDPSAREELVRRGFSPVYGARRLATVLESVCNVEVAKRIRRDDRSRPEEWRATLAWIREARAGTRAIDPEELRRRIGDLSRARLGYDRLRVVFGPGGFDYLPETASA